MKQKFTILRVPSYGATRDPILGPLAMPQLEAAGGPSGVPEIRLDSLEEASEAAISDIRRDPTVIVGAPVMPMTLIEPRSPDAGFIAETSGATWGVKAVGADASPMNGTGVTVAVLDTGVDATHPAFAGVNLVTKDFTGAGSANDMNGHGTHCAGTIFGRDVGGVRIGVAPGITKALIGKVLGGPQGGGSGVLAQAMQWAAENGATVISMSLGIDFPGYVNQLVGGGMPLAPATSQALEAYRANVLLFEKLVSFFAARASFAQGLLVVAATGNESARDQVPAYVINVAPPAASNGVIAVGALRQDPAGFMVAPFSNTGASIAAPGVNITSAWIGGGLRSISGTSMATPHVAGVAALWAQHLAQFGPVNPATLQAKLLGSGTLAGLAPGVSLSDVGAGLVRAPAAVS